MCPEPLGDNIALECLFGSVGSVAVACSYIKRVRELLRLTVKVVDTLWKRHNAPRTFMYEESSYLSASIVKNFHIFTEKDKYEPLNSYFTAAKVTNIF